MLPAKLDLEDTSLLIYICFKRRCLGRSSCCPKYSGSVSFLLRDPDSKKRSIIDKNNLFIFPLYAAVAWYFGAPKYPKRFVNPTMGLLRNPTRIKKTAALRFVFNALLIFNSIPMNTKPLRFRFGCAIWAILQLFFWFCWPLGLTVFFGKACSLLKQASKMSNKTKRCVHTKDQDGKNS